MVQEQVGEKMENHMDTNRPYGFGSRGFMLKAQETPNKSP